MTALYLTSGMFMLFFGGHYLVKHAVLLAQKFNISSLVIGLTIVAFGTSAPELVVSLDAILTDHDEIVIGNIIGSNITNILLVLPLSALIYPIIVARPVILREGSTMIGATILFTGLCLTGVISLSGGLVLCLGLTAFLVFSLLYPCQSEQEMAEQQVAEFNDDESVSVSLLRSGIMVLLHCGVLAVGSYLFVEGAVGLSLYLGVSEAIVGLTVVAVATSSPEIVTSVIAAWHKHSDVVIGNVLGSNVFNLLGITGITALVSPIAVHPHFIDIDVIVLLTASIGIVLFIYLTRSIGRASSGVMLLAYIGYIVSLF